MSELLSMKGITKRYGNGVLANEDASFSLRAGETLVLYDSVGRRYDALLIPETAENVSIGRDENGAVVFYSHPTPLEENGNPIPTGK